MKIILVQEDITLRLNDKLTTGGMVCATDDFTIYLTRQEVAEGLSQLKEGITSLPIDAFDKEAIKKNKPGKSSSSLNQTAGEYAKYLKPSIDATVEITCSGLSSAPELTLKGRANLALYQRGEGFSVTIRIKEREGLDKDDAGKTEFEKSRPDMMISNGKLGGEKCLLSKIKPEVVPCGTKNFLFDPEVTCRALARLIFNQKIKTGLIVVSGATGCGKSQVALGLIWEYIQRITTWKRRPHLLTIEDPIENSYLNSIDLKIMNRTENHKMNRQRGFDYTPRNLRTDVTSLKQALMDAKRMTPAAVFIGETRDKKDWREVVDFAGSGHLVMTTTHAGSLVETIQRIFKAVEANTPAERGNTAQSLLAVIHIQSFSLAEENGGAKEIKACVPALWTNAGGGAATLVADGLASIVPNNPPSVSNVSEAKGCLGRTWLAKAINKEVETRLNENLAEKEQHSQANVQHKEYWRTLFNKTLESDLLTL